MQYVLLADLARQWLFENGEQTEDKFARANYHAIQVAKQLNQHLLRPIQPVRLSVRANKTAVLPADFVSLHKVALVRAGEVVTLTAFTGLVRDRPADASGNPGASQGLDGKEVTVAYADWEMAHYAHTELGVGGGFNAAGHYLLDLPGGQLILGGDVPADAVLYLEYLASGIPASGTPQVTVLAEFAIISYLDWKMVDKLRGVSSGEKKRLLEEHKRQNRLLQRLLNLTTAKELREATSKFYSKTVR